MCIEWDTIRAMTKKAAPGKASVPPARSRSPWPRRIRFVSLAVVASFATWIGAHATAKPAGPSTLAPATADAPLPAADDNGFTFLRSKSFTSLKSPSTALLSQAEDTPWTKLDIQAFERAYDDEKIQEKLSGIDEGSLKPEFADDCLYDMPTCSTLAVYAAHQNSLFAGVFMTLRNPEADEGPARIAGVIRMADKHSATAKSLISEMVAMTAMVRSLKLALGFGKSGLKNAALRDTLAGLTIRRGDAARVIRQESVWTHTAVMSEEKAMPWSRRALFAGADTMQMYDDGLRPWLRTFENAEPPPGPPVSPKSSAFWWLWNPIGKSMLSILDTMTLAGKKLHETFQDAQNTLDEAKKAVR